MRLLPAISVLAAAWLGCAQATARAQSATGTATRSSSAGEVSPYSVTGYVQLDYSRFDRSSDQLSDGTGQPLNEDRFFVREARVKLAGDWGYLAFNAQGELSTAQGPAVGVRLVEAILKYPGARGEPPLIRLAGGIFPIPFSHENYAVGSENRFFAERALISDALFPGRFDAGVSLSGNYRFLSWILAVQNGEPIGTRAFPGRDPNGAKDLSGRIAIKAELAEGVRLSGGVSALAGTGFSPGRPPTKDTFVWRDFNEDGLVSASELQVVKGSSALASQNFDRWAAGLDVQLALDIPVLGELLAYGEAITAVNLDRAVAPADPITLGRDQRSRGFYAALVQHIGEYFMAGARVDLYDPNLDATQLLGGETVVSRRTFTTWTFGVAALLRIPNGPRSRLLAEYAMQKNTLGRDSSGRPAQLDNDAVRFRLEVVF